MNGIAAVALAASLVGVASPVRAPAQDAAAAVTLLNVGNDMAMPGDRASLPIMLKAAAGVRVGRTVNALTFPTSLLAFEEAIAESARVEVRAVVARDEQHPDRSVVEITAVAKDGVIPDGLIATAVFRVAKDARRATDPIMLPNVPRAEKAGAGKERIAPIAGSAGEIEVMGDPAEFACFFYMH